MPAPPRNTLPQAASAVRAEVALRVALPLPLPPFSFLPPHGAPLPALGSRVAVPWQGGVRVGLVVAYEALRGGAGLELRELIGALEPHPFVTEVALAVLTRLAEHTCAPLGTVLANFLPTGLHEALQHEVRLLAPVAGGVAGLTEAWCDARGVPPHTLEALRRGGLLEERVRVSPPQVQRLVPLKRADAELAGKPREAQRRALAALWALGAAESAAALARDADAPESAVRALVKKGYAGYRALPAPPPPLPYAVAAEAPSAPLGAETLPSDPLVSVSGGSREARLRRLVPQLRADLAAGGSVLVLAPEGALLHAAGACLGAYLPVLTLSGELPDAQRARVWEACARGEPVVLLGTYVALFAPLRHLARVVVLEESSGAYKLASGCRAFVPTAARFLAEAAAVPLVLADALASPETHLKTAAQARLTLPKGPPRVHLVDLREGGGWPLSTDLVRVLKQVAERERQAVLLAPRRGFSAALRCAACDFLAMCPNCDLPLRYHRERYVLRCHQCAHAERAPDTCPSCGSPALSPTRAAGTQWVAAEVAKLLPGFLIRRFDADKRDDLSALLAGAPGVLVATTAALRAPPLPNVSLVAVTLLDAFLNMGDFRAEEEAYRLLLNLAELAPARRPLTLIQTFQSDHPLLQAYTQGADEAFLEALLARRRRFRYPPFAALAKVQISARQSAVAEREAAWLAGALRTAGVAADELLGPSPAPVARVKNLYSYHLFVRTEPERLTSALAPALAYQGAARVRIDVDPRDVAGFLD
ncbi:replication restart helicase PriA [Truepera radiovictrix]|uniref:replication restart helicase PriA n=1 Tax=Truepera radiovictrix TaxID=332249 RepID=UPI000674EA49|nr:primosomal protein N' [Truepera radiovictrix]WMT56744.1 primosomal protein N' [Truepera radiovictrix]